MRYFLLLVLLSFFFLFGKLHSQDQLMKYTAIVHNASQANGYYFLFTFKMNKRYEKGNNQQMIIDGNGHTVFYRLTPQASDFKLHSNKRMSFFNGSKFVLMDSMFNIVDSVACVNGIETDSHDFLILPNGHYLMLGLKCMDVDLSSYNIFMQKKLPGSKNAMLKFGVVQELNQKKELIYQWDSENHFKIENANKVYLNNIHELDVTHFNSVDITADSCLLISARYSSEIIKVNVKKDSVLWRLGGPLNQFKFINGNLPFSGQHDARMIEKDVISLFDNGYGPDYVKHNARALKYKLNEVDKTADLIWYYENEERIISEATGNVQCMKNGNTLISYGKIAKGIPNITFEFVNPDKQKIFSLSFEDTVGTYRTFYYPELPFKLNRPEVLVKNKGNVVKLYTNGSYPSYQWNTGETTPNITVTKPGTYFVYVPVGDGGMLSSIPVEIK